MHIKTLYVCLLFISLLFGGVLYLQKLAPTQTMKATGFIDGMKDYSQYQNGNEEDKDRNDLTVRHINDCISIGTTWNTGYVYYPCGTQLYPAAMIQTSVINPEIYRYDRGQVFYIKREGRNLTIKEEVPLTVAFGVYGIKILSTSGDNRYIRIGNEVFFNEKAIAGVDADTFRLIGQYEFPQGPETFPGSQPVEYAKDKNTAYFRGRPIPGADPETFTFLPTGPYRQEYATDKNHVYYLGDLVQNADPKTFKSFSTQPYEGPKTEPYAVDAKHVFYKTNPVPEADVKTFKTVIYDYAKDGAHVFKEGKVVPEANPKTFTFPMFEMG